MRFWMVFAWLSSALLLATAQETVLTDDALQKPITVWQRLASLAEVLEDIRNQTGVPLRCQDALRETKLAVYVQNRPAREILEQIAALFELRWRRDEDGSYVLYLPDETRRALERALRDDRAATERALREVVQHCS
jgi:benzoyl-CoA reductase/2-hydroxyglutaryl-CoA dehydratase subunit BcrC/BadD/HgdB